MENRKKFKLNKKIIYIIILIITIALAIYNLKFLYIALARWHSYNYIFTAQWGTKGEGNGQFIYPSDLSIDSKGNVYIVDQQNNCVQKFTSNGEFITKWGTRGEEYGQFNSPHGIFINVDDKVYVTDSSNYRIQKFDFQGKFISVSPAFLSERPNIFSADKITGDLKNKVYATDLDKICLFDSSLELKDTWDWRDMLEFTNEASIINIAINSKGYLFILIYENDLKSYTVYKCNQSGEIIQKWGVLSKKKGDLYNIGGIAVDSKDYILITDQSNHQVDIYDSMGNLLKSFGSKGFEDGQFNNPGGITVDRKGNVYVIDSGNYRIQKFSPNSNYKPENSTKEE